MKSIPLLRIKSRNGSNGVPTIERDYLSFTVLQCYDSNTESEAKAKLTEEIDDIINQLLVIRACL